MKSPGIKIWLKCPANQFPALFANQNVLEFRSAVSGDDDYKFDFEYELDKPYYIEICQSKEAGNVTFNILIDGQIVHSTLPHLLFLVFWATYLGQRLLLRSLCLIHH